MIPKFRAYDSGSLSRMYRPDEVMVGDSNIWIIDEDSVAGDWIVNNDIHLMQSTGLKDKNGKEIFEGDIITNGMDVVDVRNHETLGFYTLVNGREVFFGHGTSIEEFEEDIEGFTEIAEIIGNIYENPELLEVEE
ncbi:YopX family protein [Streptococcus infantis]|uniref:YopX family protein n=1 Tax=Streptococcus infantis TaxID=68892 RepID=UPI00205886FA|nr:MAG TPA: YopX protein [Caudoviricetes sp.]